jgi:hypothetical protein
LNGIEPGCANAADKQRSDTTCCPASLATALIKIKPRWAVPGQRRCSLNSLDTRGDAIAGAL